MEIKEGKPIFLHGAIQSRLSRAWEWLIEQDVDIDARQRSGSLKSSELLADRDGYMELKHQALTFYQALLFCRSFVLVFVIGALFIPAASQGASESPRSSGSSSKESRKLSQKIDAVVLRLENPLADQEALAQELSQFPREQLRARLEERLESHSEPQLVLTLTAIRLTEMKELLPALRVKARTSTDWLTLNVINKLSTNADEQSKNTETYMARLMSPGPSALRLAALDGLVKGGAVLPDAVYEKLLSDRSYAIRETAVRQFLQTRTQYSNGVQAKRFDLAMRVKPYTVRLEAFRGLASLEKSQRDLLNLSLEEKTCEKEEQPEVKRACLDVLSYDKRRGSK